MNKLRLSFLAASISIASFLLVSGNAFAHKNHKENYKENYKGSYKGETCPVPLTLKGGLYLGMQGGYDLYRVVQNADVTIIDPFIDVDIPGFGYTASIDPRLTPSGGVLGAFIGYGMYFEQFYNAYLGLEAFGAFSAARADYEVELDNLARVGQPDQFNKFKTHVEAESNYGIDVIPGIKLNPATLLYVRLGYNWTNIEITQTIGANRGTQSFIYPPRKVKLKELAEPGGFHYGVGIEVATGSFGSFGFDNLSVRAEYTHTSFNNFDANNNDADNLILTDVSAADNQFMLGIIYHMDWL